jgi:hypothetical protein
VDDDETGSAKPNSRASSAGATTVTIPSGRRRARQMLSEFRKSRYPCPRSAEASFPSRETATEAEKLDERPFPPFSLGKSLKTHKTAKRILDKT